MKTTTAIANYVSKFSKEFYTVVGIYDAKTQILIGRSACKNITRSSYRAECYAIDDAKHYVLENWACKWWCNRYGITASQFDAMLQDGVIDPLESFTFKVEEQRVYKLNPQG